MMQLAFHEIKNLSKPTFLDEDEWMRLTEEEAKWLIVSLNQLKKNQGRWKSSFLYSFSRDYTLPVEKALFKKWALGRRTLVKIGLGEGTAERIFRSVMHPAGSLHLIEFLKENAGAKLKVRPWLAKLNLKFAFHGRCYWHKDSSRNVALCWNQMIDLLFINSQSEKDFLANWKNWSSFVRKAGVALFYNARFAKGDGASFDGLPGPTFAVDRLFRGPNRLSNWKIVEERGTTVVVQRKS